MDDDDTRMGETRELSTLPKPSSISHPPLPSHLPSNLPNTASPALAPSLMSQRVPGIPGDGMPFPGHGTLPFHPPMDTAGLMLPDHSAKQSDSESPSADQLLKEDSLVESSSDWAAAEDEADVTKPGVAVGSLATGLCYDPRMRWHCEVNPSADVHPEDPRRIYYIYLTLCKAGLVDSQLATRPLVTQPLRRITVRRAQESEIVLIHTEAHYAFVRGTKDMSDAELILLEHEKDSIYFNKLTFDASLLAAGGAIETCLAVARRQVKNAVAVIRPPGHHAETDKAMGFCLFNNVSVAARVCQQEVENCRKILILDWDVHHGNGIQKAFYDDPNVLYISLHVHQDGRFYPPGPEGNMNHCGTGPGLGKNVNIPWPEQGMGDGDYMHAFREVVMPIATEFDPDLVIISAGFDAAAGDVLGGCFVTPPCYAHMTHMLMSLANGKVAVCLEGGYNFMSISKSALAVTRTLMGEPPDRLHAPMPSNFAKATVGRVKGIQAHYWSSMLPKPIARPSQAERLHDVIRDYQSKQLYEDFKLTPLFIYRTAISRSFKNQVMASSNYHEKVPLIVVFHDPPELIGYPDPVTNKLEAHNTWLANADRDYYVWIKQKGYGVIDVNIPKYITRELANTSYEDEDENRPTATEELAGYLWDNYIEPNEATEIFLLGIGNSFYGVANLLINRENLYKRVTGVISFVAENPLRAIASPTQVWLSKWYRDNSLVFVAHTHGVWDPERKPSKRYGRLIQSPESDLSAMLARHKPEVFSWISERTDEYSDGEDHEDEAGVEAERDQEMKDG